MRISTIAALAEAKRQRHPVALAKNLMDGTEFLLPAPAAPLALHEAAAEALRRDHTATHEIDGVLWFIEAHNPAPRLILVGAVHIAQHLTPFAIAAGYEVTIIDPRGAFATAARFPGIAILAEWPGPALAALRPDAATAIVTLTHDPKLDDPALDAALHSAAFYIGALGSRKTHAARLQRLAERGHGAAALHRIHAPVGLAIGASGQAEIALSIIAEIIATRRGSPLATRS